MADVEREVELSCPACEGPGEIECIACKGKGEVKFFAKAVDCPVCDGSRATTCPGCNGSGNVSVNVKISKGEAEMDDVDLDEVGPDLEIDADWA